MALNLTDIEKPLRSRVKRNPSKRATLDPWEKPEQYLQSKVDQITNIEGALLEKIIPTQENFQTYNLIPDLTNGHTQNDNVIQNKLETNEPLIQDRHTRALSNGENIKFSEIPFLPKDETRNKPVTEKVTTIEAKDISTKAPPLPGQDQAQETRNKPVIGGTLAETDGTEYINIEEANLESTDDASVKTRNKPVINPKQTRNETTLNPEQTRNKPVIETRNDNLKNSNKDLLNTKTRNKPVTYLVTNPEQTRNGITNNFVKSNEHSYATSTKFQREILNLLFDEIYESLETVTRPMSLAEFGEKLSRSNTKELESLRIIILRLEKMGLILRVRVKPGRGGWTQYSLPKSVFIHIKENRFNNKPVINPEQTRNKPVSQTVTESSSSSSSNINTTNTETEDSWNKIQIPQSLRAYNFGPHLIKQVRERNLLDVGELQSSLDAFAFDVSENDLISKKKINDPIRYFMGITNKKMQYAPSGNFLTDEFKGLEENKKRFEMLKNKREELEIINTELAFEEWFAGLSNEDKIAFVPENEIFRSGTSFHNQLLKSYFLESVLNRPAN